MKKTLSIVLILFIITLSSTLSYASNSKSKSAKSNSINPKAFVMLPYGKYVVHMRLSGTNIIYPADKFERFYDPQTNVMCYSDRAGATQQGGFSCVYLGKKK
jgi:hypothetical protein